MISSVLADVRAGILPRRLFRVPLTPINVRTLVESGIETDADYVRSDACDPRRPVLHVAIDGREWLIDGWHRARRAVLMGWPELIVFQLTPAEDKACRICACCGPADGVPLTIEGFPLRVPRTTAIHLLIGSLRRERRHNLVGKAPL